MFPVIAQTVATLALAANPTPANMDNTIYLANGDMYMFASTCTYDGRIPLSEEKELQLEAWMTNVYDAIDHKIICIPNK